MEWLLMVGLALLIGLVVLHPLLRRRAIDYDWDGTKSETRREQRTLEIENEVLRFREALRAGTVCTRCSQANPPGSRFCGDCGRPLRNVQPGSAPLRVPSA
jgi:hypothetical protein